MTTVKYFFLVMLAGVLILSCEKERDIVEEIDNYPGTVDLEERTIEGTVWDEQENPINNALVEIIVDGTVIADTYTENGTFQFLNQAVHESRTLIRVQKNDYMPNFASFNLKDLEELNFDFGLVQPDATETFEGNQAIAYESAHVSFSIPAASLEAGDEKSILNVKRYKIIGPGNPKLPTNLAMQNSGVDFRLDMSEAIHIQLIDELGEKKQLASNEAYEISFSPKYNIFQDSLAIWSFDESKARWLPAGLAMKSGDSFSFRTSEFTYFSYQLPCGNFDGVGSEIPVVKCISHITASLVNGVGHIYAVEIDQSSFDLGGPNPGLTPSIYLEGEDLCGSGQTTCQPFITICSNQVGKELEITLVTTNTRGFSSSCTARLTVLE